MEIKEQPCSDEVSGCELHPAERLHIVVVIMGRKLLYIKGGDICDGSSVLSPAFFLDKTTAIKSSESY